MPLMWGDFGKGFVHFFDEISLNIIMKELDTITDFVNYLSRKEYLYSSRDQAEFLIEGGEEDLLAFYLTNDESFDTKADLISLDSDLWSTLKLSKEYSNWRSFIARSEFWDNMIELLIKDYRDGTLFGHTEYENFDLLIRTMAKESRASRAELSDAFADFYRNPKTRARFARASSGVGYVFLTTKRDEEREFRRDELIGRSLIVRKYMADTRIVIGIATEKNDGKQEYSFDHVYLDFISFPKEWDKKVEELVKDTGWFKQLTSS